MWTNMKEDCSCLYLVTCIFWQLLRKYFYNHDV